MFYMDRNIKNISQEVLLTGFTQKICCQNSSDCGQWQLMSAMPSVEKPRGTEIKKLQTYLQFCDKLIRILLFS